MVLVLHVGLLSVHQFTRARRPLGRRPTRVSEGSPVLSQAQAAGSSHASPSRPSPSSVRPMAAASPHAHAYPPQDSLAGVGGDVQEAFSQGPLRRVYSLTVSLSSHLTLVLSHFFSGSRRNLRNDLLVAADSITNTVSSLVKELHSGKQQATSGSTQPHPNVRKTLSLVFERIFFLIR